MTVRASELKIKQHPKIIVILVIKSTDDLCDKIALLPIDPLIPLSASSSDDCNKTMTINKTDNIICKTNKKIIKLDIKKHSLVKLM